MPQRRELSSAELFTGVGLFWVCPGLNTERLADHVTVTDKWER